MYQGAWIKVRAKLPQKKIDNLDVMIYITSKQGARQLKGNGVREWQGK